MLHHGGFPRTSTKFEDQQRPRPKDVCNVSVQGLKNIAEVPRNPHRIDTGTSTRTFTCCLKGKKRLKKGVHAFGGGRFCPGPNGKTHSEVELSL